MGVSPHSPTRRTGTSSERTRRRARDDSWHDVVSGVGGAFVMGGAFVTPFLRPLRNRWGLDRASARAGWPGDQLVPEPRWQWSHAIEVNAPAPEVWPWIAQIGADRAGFYSYQWLENLAGCDIENAETVHPEWAARTGDDLVLHPDAPALQIVEVEAGHWLVAHGAPDPRLDPSADRWITASWLFLVRPLADHRCQVVSRYRIATSPHLSLRLQYGPTVMEPIGFAMDRRMLKGIKRRAERAWRRR
jgi:hypothetical protein